MRELKVGATCKVWGEAHDRFTIIQLRGDGSGALLNDNAGRCHGWEGREKIHSIRYPPRPKSYYTDNLNRH